MKYLAILKDSLLEALDTKVFYALAGLSCLVLLVVASVSYRPVTVEEEAERLAGNFNWLMGLRARGQGKEPPVLSVADFRETNAQAPPWERDYHFNLVLSMSEAEAKDAGDLERKLGARELRSALRQQFGHLKDLEVTPAEARNPREVRFVVSTRGSKVERTQDWPHEPTAFFAVPIKWHEPVGTFVHFWEDTIVNTVGASIALLISAIVTAFFIPNMLRKGTVDLLLVKPIHRTTLLLYKYVGGLVFMFLNTTFVVVGLWLILGLRTGLWGAGFLASIPVLTFQFAFYYAVSALFGVLTRSAIVSILMSCLAWFVFSFVIGTGYTTIDATRKMPELFSGRKDAGKDDEKKKKDADAEQMPRPLPEWVYTSADVVHFVTPRLRDLDALTTKLIVEDTLPDHSKQRRDASKLLADFNWGEALGVTLLYIAVLLALACGWFALKEY